MNEKEAHRKYVQEFQARMEMKAQSNPKIAQALQLSQALRDAYASCEGNKSLYSLLKGLRYSHNTVLQRLIGSKSIMQLFQHCKLKYHGYKQSFY